MREKHAPLTPLPSRRAPSVSVISRLWPKGHVEEQALAAATEGRLYLPHACATRCATPCHVSLDQEAALQKPLRDQADDTQTDGGASASSSAVAHRLAHAATNSKEVPLASACWLLCVLPCLPFGPCLLFFLLHCWVLARALSRSLCPPSLPPSPALPLPRVSFARLRAGGACKQLGGRRR